MALTIKSGTGKEFVYQERNSGINLKPRRKSAGYFTTADGNTPDSNPRDGRIHYYSNTADCNIHDGSNYYYGNPRNGNTGDNNSCDGSTYCYGNIADGNQQTRDSNTHEDNTYDLADTNDDSTDERVGKDAGILCASVPQYQLPDLPELKKIL